MNFGTPVKIYDLEYDICGIRQKLLKRIMLSYHLL
jgi:hypothetical protein